MKRVFRLNLLPIVAGLTGAIALSATETSAYADGPKCGSSAGMWSVPKGALVLSKAGNDGLIGGIMQSIGELNGHSMISHGPTSGLSHATRTEDVPSNDSIIDGCGMPIVAESLKRGWPGAERVDVPGAYAFLEKNTALNGPGGATGVPADLQYFEAVAWQPYSASVPSECKNPQLKNGVVTCDPIDACKNAHVNPMSPAYVQCEPIPGCSDNPYVIGDIIACDSKVSGCNNGGHMNTVWGSTTTQECTVCPSKAPHFECNPSTDGKICKKYSQGCNPDTDCTGPQIKCTQWTTGPISNPENDTRAAAAAKRGPSVLVQFGGSFNNGNRTLVPGGQLVADYLDSLNPNIVLGGDPVSVAQWADDVLHGRPDPVTQSNYRSYGLFYDFSQYSDLDQVNLGTILTPAEGVVCSTFLSWGQKHAIGEKVVEHYYSTDQVAAAANRVFEYARDQCHAAMLKESQASLDLVFARCLGLEPVCNAAGRQAVNCFAFGRCDTDDENLYNQATQGHRAARSISPDRLGGVGPHTPVWKPQDDQDVHTNEPMTSVWAHDVPNKVMFSSSGTFGCWD